MLFMQQGVITPQGVEPNELHSRQQIAQVSPIVVTDTPDGIKPRILPDAQPLIIQEKFIPDGIDVTDARLQLPISPDAASKSPNFRRRHSVSGARSFARPEYLPRLAALEIGTIEERKSIFLEKSIFLDKEQ